MMVAVVADTQEHAIEAIARLGMVLNARALTYGVSPLLGTKFTCILVVGDPNRWLSDRDWWTELLGRNSGPVWRLTQ